MITEISFLLSDKRRNRKMKIDRRFRNALYMFLVFVIWTVLVRVVDTAAIGPMDTVVGFSSVNGMVHNALGTNAFWYSVSKILGYLAIALAGFFAVIGLVQLIRRKSLAEVDGKILAAGVIYICVIIAYVLFDKLIINYRPVIMPDNTVPEASYPSTHAMLGCVSFGIGAMTLKDYMKSPAVGKAVSALCWVLAVMTVVARLLSGVHWLTDIIGGVIISVFFLMLYNAACRKIDYLEHKKAKS